MYKEYFDYLKEHRKNIRKACDYWEKKMIELFPYSYYSKKEKRELHLNFIRIKLTHDINKFQPKTFIAYAKWFHGEYGVNTKDSDLYIERDGATYLDGMKYLYYTECRNNFFDASNRHTNNTKHHWKYWENEDIPLKYIIEMIVDWTAMGYKFKNSPQDYYLSNYHNIKINRETRFLLENNLGLLFYDCPLCEGNPEYWMTIYELKNYLKQGDVTLNEVLAPRCDDIINFDKYDI